MKLSILTLLWLIAATLLLQDASAQSTEGCKRRYLRKIRGKCYYFSVKKMNWFGALNNCVRKGLVLADLSSSADFGGVVDFLSSKGNTEDFWFGGNDLQTEGRFQYISNGLLTRYFSNHSLVDPAENSDCDDCLEVRIRSNLTSIADDNCLERQYFICSERYCVGPDAGADAKKPRHHSHEHLHHFHHDIGVSTEEVEDGENPYGGASESKEKGRSKEQGRDENAAKKDGENAGGNGGDTTPNLTTEPTLTTERPAEE